MAQGVYLKTWHVKWVIAALCCATVSRCCDVTFGDYTYKEEVLVSGVKYPYGLAVDYRTHNLYFSYENETMKYIRAKVDIKSKVITVLEGLSGLCKFTVDQVRGYVHAGCNTNGRAPGGLYQWDSNTGHFELAGELGRSVRFVYYYNGTLYYSFYPRYLLHAFTKGHPLSTLSMQMLELVIDGQGDFIFRNWSGLYRLRGDGTGLTQYKEFEYSVRDVSVDDDGIAYACDNEPNGIWRLHNHTSSTTRLLDVPCSGLTFDSSNIIYADGTRRSIVRLVKC